MAAGPGWLVVGSTAAGSSGEELIEAVAGRLSRHGPTESTVTGTPDELDEVVRSCGDRVLVVVGGDGSAHVAVNALDRTGLLGEVTVGFVPLGTANDLATHLGMSADCRDAARQLVGGRRRRIDVMRLTGDDLGRGEVVVNALHAGLGVDGARRGGPLKPVLGPLAYPVGVAASGLVSRGHRVAIRIDERPVDVDGRVLAVAVSNAPRLGGVELMADADPEDAHLHLLVVPARPWRARLGSVLQAAGRHPASLEVRQGRTVEVEGDLGEVDADGEMVAVGRRCRVEVVPAALEVLAAPA